MVTQESLNSIIHLQIMEFDSETWYIIQNLSNEKYSVLEIMKIGSILHILGKATPKATLGRKG